jgi:hypothetical protein
MSASSFTIQYPELVTVNAVQDAIHLADLQLIGHRVQVPVNKTILNTHFRWTVPEGQTEPEGVIQNVAPFVAHLSQVFSTRFVDLDADTEGLSFDTDTLNAIADPRLRENNQITINDVVMAEVLYKLYEKTLTTTKDNIFNPEDAYGMLNNESLALAVGLSLFSEPGTQAIKEMFTQLITKAPTRFQDASGNLLWEGTTPQTNGDWALQDDDCIEIRVEFTFLSPVSRTDPEGLSIEVPAGHKFRIRLQLVAVTPPTWSFNPRFAPLGLAGFQRSIQEATESIDFIQTATSYEDAKLRCIIPSTDKQICVGVALSDGTVLSQLEFGPQGILTALDQPYQANSSVTVEITTTTIKFYIFDSLVQTFERPDTSPLHFALGMNSPQAQITGILITSTV